MNRQGVLYEPKSLMEENWARQDIKNTLRAEASKSSHVVVAYDAYQHHGWREGKTLGTLTTAGGSIRGDTPLVVAMDCRNLTGNEEISGTLQAKNQGGHSLNFINPVVYAIEGNGQRESHKGDGWAESDQMYTLNTVERHAVVYDARGNGNGGGGTDIDR